MEVLLSVIIIGLMVSVLALSLSGIVKYFMAARMRQSLQADAERAMTIMTTTLKRAKASSASICTYGMSPGCASPFSGACTTPVTICSLFSFYTGAPLDSAILFSTGTLAGGGQGAFYWSNRNVYLKWAAGQPQSLAQNVNTLAFIADPQVMNPVKVTLGLDAPPANVFFRVHPSTVTIYNQSISLLPG